MQSRLSACRRVAGCLVLLACGLGTGVARGAEAPKTGKRKAWTLSARSAIVVDVESGQVLYAKAPDTRRFPASVTKIMTALLALERGDPNAVVVVTARAAAVGESSAHLVAGDRVTLHDLLVAALLPSANDAATAIAEHIGGSVEGFVALMDARARELGMTETHFENPSGLHDPRHVTSARDLARLACVALKVPAFRELVALPEAEVTRQPAGGKPPRKEKFENVNRLLQPKSGHYWPLADGVKTGYTRHAGRCLVASAAQDGWQLLCVVLGCEDSWLDARNELAWAFATFRRERVVTAGQTTARVHVVDGSPPIVTAVAKSSIDAIVPVRGGPAAVRVSESYPSAPLAAGTEVGELVVSGVDGTELRATLVTPQRVRRSAFAYLRDHLGGVFAVVAGLALIGALVLHGAVAKAAGPRREGLPAPLRRDDQGGPRGRERERGPSPGTPG
jgi:D-alanyl-D-alanine carboxypeptidase (penicillin-binding protein 5/6)